MGKTTASAAHSAPEAVASAARPVTPLTAPVTPPSNPDAVRPVVVTPSWTVPATRSVEERGPLGLEAVMNSITNSLGMRKTEIAKEPSRTWNPHFYAVFAQVHNTLYRRKPVAALLA